MKYSEVMVGITPLGELIVSCLVLLITMGLVGSVRKDYISVKIMLGGIASTFLIGYVVSLFVPVNFAWISIGLVGRVNLFILFIHSKLGMALCVNRSVRFRFYLFPIFCGLCV